MTRISMLGLAMLATIPGILSADVYWSKDADGNVVFSDTPPPGAADVSKISLPPSPSDQAVKEAEERAKRIQSQADRFAEDRKARDEAKAKAQAEREAARKEAAEAPAGGDSAPAGPLPYYQPGAPQVAAPEPSEPAQAKASAKSGR